MQVLIVEDNEFNRIVLEEMLEIVFPNMIIHTHNSAVDSLKIANYEIYDLILSDIDMPGVSGFEFYTILRNEHKITAPIVAITALAVSGDKEKILMHGFDAYISKPIDINDLIAVLKPFIES